MAGRDGSNFFPAHFTWTDLESIKTGRSIGVSGSMVLCTMYTCTYLFTTMVDRLGKERCESDILLVGCGPSLEARGRNDVDQLGSIVSVAEDRFGTRTAGSTGWPSPQR